MRLNLINPAALIHTGLYSVDCEGFNPRFGSVTKVNDNSFKYTLPGPPKEVFIFERVSLNTLFKGIPQSIVGLEPRNWTSSNETELNSLLGIDPVTQDSPFTSAPRQELPATDEYGKLFFIWADFVGLSGVVRQEVELSVMDDTLLADFKHSPIYSGTVSIKIK